MTGVELAALIRYKTGTNSTTFTDADMLPLVNTFKNEIASLIAERNQMFFAIPATDDLVGDQRLYVIPDNQLNNLVKLEVKFASGDARQPAYAIKDYDLSETESEIVKNFSNAQGDFAYTIRGKMIFLLSGTIVAVTGGLRIWYIQYPADLADLAGSTDLSVDPSTITSGFPRQFHELLARRISIEYKGSRPKPIRLNAFERNYENDLLKQLNAIAHTDLGLEIIGELPPSKDLGNNGWDY